MTGEAYAGRKGKEEEKTGRKVRWINKMIRRCREEEEKERKEREILKWIIGKCSKKVGKREIKR